MKPPNRHVLWLCIDSYTPSGVLEGSLLGGRSVETYVEASDVLDELLCSLPTSWRQLTSDEVAELLAGPGGGPRIEWEQLSIF